MYKYGIFLKNETAILIQCDLTIEKLIEYVHNNQFIKCQMVNEWIMNNVNTGSHFEFGKITIKTDEIVYILEQ